MKIKGKITSWNEEKGFGFITPASGGRQVFIHINEFKELLNKPSIGLTVMYSLSTDKQGRPCAKIAKFNTIKPKNKKDGKVSIYFALIFLLIVGISVFLWKTPLIVFFVYVLVSLVNFIAYGIDKSNARSGKWRIPENTLHIISLIGGWPGAIFAQQILRHKTKKQGFRFIFWLTVFINIGAFVWAHASLGTIQLQKWTFIF